MTSFRLGALLLVLATLTYGCVSKADQPDPANAGQLELVTGWTEGPDRRALRDLIAVFTRSHPGIRVFDASVEGSGSMVERYVSDRLTNDNAPDSIALSAGFPLRALAETGDLQDLTALLADEELARFYDPDLLDLVSIDDRVYGIPIGIQRVNVLWSNSQRLEAAGVDPDTPAVDLDAWLGNLAAVRATGVAYPLAVGDATTQLQLFESVLLADLGPDEYRELWRDPVAWTRPGVAAAIDHFGRLLAFAAPGNSQLGVADVVDNVITGESAYAVLSDSTLATFQMAEFNAGVFAAAPVPGTAGVFLLRADAFVLPVGASHQDAAVAWLRVVASRTGQVVFADAKAAIPARTGALNGTSTYESDIAWSLAHDAIVPSLAGGAACPPAWTDAIADALDRFRHDQNGAVLARVLAEAAAAYR